MENTEIELLHIELELKNNRTQHLRHFIDQYYCYKNNLINRNGRANWNKILWSSIVSKEAANTKNRKDVVKEHVVPIAEITKILIAQSTQDKFSTSVIADVLNKYVVFATISKREDELLRKAKLASKMPEEFRDINSPLFDDLYARYKKVGIEIVTP